MNALYEDEVLKNITFQKIQKNELNQFTEFVFKSYSFHYNKKYKWRSTSKDLEEMKYQDKLYFDNSFYVKCSYENQIIGTMKISLQKSQQFPIEYEFGIDLEELIQKKEISNPKIWHLGRLAIDTKFIKNNNLPITSKKIICSLLNLCLLQTKKYEQSIIIAESDNLIFQIFHEIGLEMEIVGDIQNCLGSPTYPVFISQEKISNWLTNYNIHE
ncbi:hypothetical protein [Aureivirga sp. CE67]|uniref:hypothetical protein n=1 Tax=Aureivirga sp. CE67 TaxID=1788983 RepID=UPI001E3B7EF2|nr:hypothetical protein [Aureivirga sp. CE67]